MAALVFIVFLVVLGFVALGFLQLVVWVGACLLARFIARHI